MKWIASLLFYSATVYIPVTAIIAVVGSTVLPFWIAILAWLMSAIAKENGEVEQ